MLQSLREETEGKLQMLLSLRKNGLTLGLSREEPFFLPFFWTSHCGSGPLEKGGRKFNGSPLHSC